MEKEFQLGIFSPYQVCNLLFRIALTLFVLHCISEALINFAQVRENFYQDFFDAINLDEEFNLTAFYSGMLLGIASFLLNKLGQLSGKGKRQNWIILSRVFLFLAIDEIFQIHELFVIPELRQYVHPSLASIWVIPYAAIAAYFAIKFVPFFISQGRRMSQLSLVSGVIYVTGAVGMEACNSWLVMTGEISRQGFWYEAISGIEEFLEMIGIIIFIYALLLALMKLQKKLSFKFSISSN